MRRYASELRRAGISTFEELGFVFVEDEPREEQAEQPLVWRASVGFRGPRSGTLHVDFSSEIAGELALNMLGAAPPVDVALVRDALGEVANVVCGSLVPVLGGPGDIFQLGPPTVTRLPKGHLLPDPDDIEVSFGAGSGRTELLLRMDPRPPHESES